ncbi:Transcriptional regulator, GntR family domain / Aspartate aminotransferase [Cystobacter fuscus DSM 2262]|uniref:Transcriptional regulator, GntR family domain / Aspartate aminotransferase n=1 Tax=Cystobacter fuscus (strain ATCC 25194 / DSM 2262 / NBRC 100088 / M29) TaxID=1242864 RepID=S9QK33_CYSF2|nr:PLP-dependent aminotransferase family protein [Cystobacter fuscus]EPX56853.1 Transcriptional regulator, GntR family domain / Aspartate aminotransferase [Cystobacter fuscus DSM 2262]
MTAPLGITVDRKARTTLTEQIHTGIREAIRGGRLAAGARLPSWRDLSVQLGVARGTVRAAYERLVDEQLLQGRGAAGTFVAEGPATPPRKRAKAEPSPMPEMRRGLEQPPLPFQMGVPAQDAFPFAPWARVLTKAARDSAWGPVGYPDPRGRIELRQALAAHLALVRGMRCDPSQVFVTAGFSGALDLLLRALRPRGPVWMEEPGFPLTRRALELTGLEPVPVPVDAEGLVVAEGRRRAPDAQLAIVTPGQQSPLGMTLSPARRRALLDWAHASEAWIVEDDYLSELQLEGRAAPALASLDPDGRVLHVGSFSKTLSPSLRLGFLVVPPSLVARVGEAAACLVCAPGDEPQRAVTAFMADGHYLRHLRRMKRLYRARREALLARLRAQLGEAFEVQPAGGLAVRIGLPEGLDDRRLAAEALSLGLAPLPLSFWYVGPSRPGLLLSVTNLVERRLASHVDRLVELLQRHDHSGPHVDPAHR